MHRAELFQPFLSLQCNGPIGSYDDEQTHIGELQADAISETQPGSLLHAFCVMSNGLQ